MALNAGHQDKKIGRSKFNPVYEFDLKLSSGIYRMRVTSVLGHLMTTQLPDTHSDWLTTDLMSLYNVPIERIPQEGSGGIQVIKNLQECGKDIDSLMIWTDCDREGEAIGFDIIDVVQSRKSVEVFRAKFSALTRHDIENAINNLCAPQQSLSEAVRVRQEVDLRIGASFTRFQTLTLQQEIPNEKALISYGSCQFPTLGFVVQRD